MYCKICQSQTTPLFKGLVLNKYDVMYYKCNNCLFIQTEQPFWMNEAYAGAITSTDIGYVTRNVMYSEVVASLLKSSFSRNSRYLDFGGGYGLFVRLMRDAGFDFYRQDIYCENIFAKQFDIENLNESTSFEVVTAFEVFEHLAEPLTDIEQMLSLGTSILFSTELQPRLNLDSFDDWWYFSPHTGQHLALYNFQTLKFIAKKYGLNLYSNEKNLHLLTPKRFFGNPVKRISRQHNLYNRLFARHFNNKKSLLPSDFARLMGKIGLQ